MTLMISLSYQTKTTDYGVSECAKHSLWYMNILNELNININFVTINIDNRAATFNCQNQSINTRSKHIDIIYHHLKDYIKENKINLNILIPKKI